MNPALSNHIQDAFEKMQKHFKEMEKRKAILLINAIMHFKGNDGLMKELDEKGLPKTIYVSDGIPKEVVKNLSLFAHVVRHSALQDPGILFSWTTIGLQLEPSDLLTNLIQGVKA